MMRRSLLRNVVTSVVAAISMAGFVLAGPVASSTASAQAAVKAASGPAESMIVILRNQGSGPERSSSRLATIRSEQTPLVAQLLRAGARDIKTTSIFATVTATMSPAEAASLSANPAVSEVIPNTVIKGPSRTGTPSYGSGSAGTASAGTQDASDSAICGTAKHPELDPQALSVINAPAAQNAGITGAGVTVAYLGDGIDTSNPDLQRNAAYGTPGTPVVTQVDFSGDGPNAPTGGGEAFTFASAIAAQGNETYDLSKWVNPAHPLPKGCDIKVVGVAPGANVLGLKVFPEADYSTLSAFLQAIDYAVTSGAKVINQPIDGQLFPDTTLDALEEADNAAVASGVTVVEGSGDGGGTSTTGPPATDPNVISVGATTTYRIYAQISNGGFGFSNGHWVDNNVSPVSSGGYSEPNGSTVDLVAPGDNNWAVCSKDIALYSSCENNKGQGSNLVITGGADESSALTAGAAAMVIEAYSETHGGSDPSPALVKQILLSTATDIDAPATEQGAGLLNVDAAVKDAESLPGTSASASGSMLVGPNQINEVVAPGTTMNHTITVNNASPSSEVVNLSTRTLDQQMSDQSGEITIHPKSHQTFLDQDGYPNVYQKETFTVPAVPPGSVSRLEFSADYRDTGQEGPLNFLLLEPNGTYSVYSQPQGLADYGEAEVANPPAGEWTAVFYTLSDSVAPGTKGPVEWNVSTYVYGTGGTISPATLDLPAGQSQTATLTATSPSDPGDTSQSVVISPEGGLATTIPVTIRTEIPIHPSGGTFRGVLTGGNGWNDDSQTNTFAFKVPSGLNDLDASFAFANDPVDQVDAYLLDPSGQTVGYSTNYTVTKNGTPTSTRFVDVYHAQPTAGPWKLILQFTNPVSGMELREPFRGAIRFNEVSVSSNLPDRSSVLLRDGSSYSFTVKVKNTGLAPEGFFADPRLDATETVSLSDLNPYVPNESDIALPLLACAPSDSDCLGYPFPYYFVPPGTTELEASATATVPVTFDLSVPNGDPDVSPAVSGPGVTGGNGGDSANLTLTEPEVSTGVWFIDPAEIGPYGAGGAPSATANVSLSAVTQEFDPTAISSTDDFWEVSDGQGGTNFAPEIVEPGHSGSITVSITPQSSETGAHVSGTLYVDDYTLASGYGVVYPNGDVLAAIPYAYTAKS
jgi:hypothetical protein